MTNCKPTTLDEICDAVQSAKHCHVRGAGTKSALSTPCAQELPESTRIIDSRGYHGIVEYEPTEYTVTVRSGTTLSDLAAALHEQGQYLPFDPPFASNGATIGGTIGAGLSGPGRWRHGGLRDFILGVQVVDGRGKPIWGGGKVVKNAAGFDLPKLMVGSCGWFGLLTEITLKVFPVPEYQATLRAKDGSFSNCLREMTRLASEPLDLEAVELFPAPGGDAPAGELLVRLAGETDGVKKHAERIMKSMKLACELLDPADADQRWSELNTAIVEDQIADRRLEVKVPLNVHLIEPLETAFQKLNDQDADLVRRRYSMGGNVGWFSFQHGTSGETVDQYLSPLASSWLAIQGVAKPVGRMVKQSAPFARMIKSAIDGDDRWCSALSTAIWE